MFDIWNQQSELADNIYRKSNYCIKDNLNNGRNLCYIFFSSNNVWFPNTLEAFKRSFVENDYYEWNNYCDLPADKIIYVRDIYKSWYVTGINENLNSIDKLIEFLRIQTSGMEVITVGSSAGGYMAALTAALLNAKYCICFSAQFDLNGNGALGVNPFLKKYSFDDNRNKYYNIADIIRNSNTEIFYVMPAYCEADCEQSKYVADIKNVNIMRIASRSHGVPLLKGNLLKLLQMDKDSLDRLFDSREEQVIGVCNISVKICGVKGTVICLKNEFVRLIKKLKVKIYDRF